MLARVFARALDRLEPIDLRSMTAQALQMGDEGHNRNRAGTSLLLRELLPALIELDEPSADTAAVARFIAGNDHFFLNMTMPASKACADAARDIDRSSIVVAMARNGTEFGIRLSGTGDRWFTGPSGMIDGLYLPGFGPEDANPDIGDSTITETVGLGGFAMAAAPAIVRVVGGGADDALEATRSMYDISWGESRSYQIPQLGFRGTPFGIDVRRGRAHAPAAVRQHGDRAPRARGGADRRGRGEAADGGVREGRAGAGRAVIAHTVAAPVAGRTLRVTHVSRHAGYADLDGFVVVVVGPGGPLLPNGVVLTGPPETGRVVLEGATIWDPTLRLRGDESITAPGDAPLAHALRDPVLAAEIARGLIGRGPGLTPEGDDAVAVHRRDRGRRRCGPQTARGAAPRRPPRAHDGALAPRCSNSPRRA